MQTLLSPSTICSSVVSASAVTRVRLSAGAARSHRCTALTRAALQRRGIQHEASFCQTRLDECVKQAQQMQHRADPADVYRASDRSAEHSVWKQLRNVCKASLSDWALAISIATESICPSAWVRRSKLACL